MLSMSAFSTPAPHDLEESLRKQITASERAKQAGLAETANAALLLAHTSLAELLQHIDNHGELTGDEYGLDYGAVTMALIQLHKATDPGYQP